MEWRFNKLTKNETIRNPSHLEFFHDEALQSVVDAFVREDIQNRLDAKAKNAPCVILEYSLCGPKLTSEVARWFKGLEKHLSAHGVEEELGYKPEINNTITWLLAEDFETTGLNGDPECYQDPPPDELPRNDFYWFIRNVGRSGKSGADRGRWGLGKIVYPAASELRSFFAYSVQEGTHRNILIGRSVLATHRLDDAQHDSDGYFGEYIDQENKYFATPAEDPSVIESFRKDFQIRRMADQPGLSIAIPFPGGDLSFARLIESIVKHWFMVLIEGRLQVKINQGDETVMVNGDTLEDVIRQQIDKESHRSRLLRQVDFARVVNNFDQAGEHFFSLKRPSVNRQPTWNRLEDQFESPDNQQAAKEAYSAGKAVGFEVPVQVAREDGTIDAFASFEVFLRRTDDHFPPSEVFLRDGMAILGLGRVRESGLLAMVRAESNELGNLLGDAENPAHTRWEQGGKHFRKKYTYGPSILALVKQAAERISSFLTTSEEGQDKELLRNLFYLPEEGEGKTKKKRKTGGLKTEPDDPDPAGKKLYIQVLKRNDGFVVSPHPDADRPPDRIIIRAAYNVDRGNPYKAHHPADFDFSKNNGGIKIEPEGMELVQKTPNRLVYSLTDKNFKFAVEGFDRNRDLVVNVRPETDISAEGTHNPETNSVA